LLDISRIEAGQPMVLDYQPVRLDNLAREVLLTFQEYNPRHRFELHCLTAQTEIQADLGRIRQVFTNLVSNAVKYSPRGGLIKITLAERERRCRCSVADEGIGMTAEQVAHSCDSFYRADASNTAIQGVGLGMSIVRHIILAHHGTLQIESELGSGTTVHFELPAAPAAGAAEPAS
jgi:signal transduction histidine kinase